MLTLWGSFGVAGFIRKFSLLSVGNAREGAAQAAAGMLLLCGFPSAASEIARLLTLFLLRRRLFVVSSAAQVNSETAFGREKNQPRIQFEA